jgi:hypothetical protein
MFDVIRTIKIGITVMATTVMLVAGSSVSHAETGSVRIIFTKAGFS